MNFENFHKGGLIKVTLFYINCLKKTFVTIHSRFDGTTNKAEL